MEIPAHVLQCKVCDFVNSDGHWAWDMFQIFLPLQNLVLIVANKPPSDSNGDDEMYWKLSSSRKFTFALAYNLIVERDWPSVSTRWKMVWEWNGPRGFVIFVAC